MEPLTPAQLATITRYGWGPRTITYSFYVDDLPDYWTNDRLNNLFGSGQNRVTPISQKQRAAFDAAVSPWSSVANINLQEETQGIGDIFVARIPFRPGPGVEIKPKAQAAVISRARLGIGGGDGAVRGMLEFLSDRVREAVYLLRITSFVLLALMSAEALAQDSPAAIQDGIEISWSDCTEAAQKFFLLHLSDAGDVHYQGFQGVRTLDARQATIGSSAASRIEAKATAFLASRQTQKTEREPKRGTFCVNVTSFRKGGAGRSRTERSDARSAAALIREVDRLVEPRQWACPARKLESSFIATGYCIDQPLFHAHPRRQNIV